MAEGNARKNALQKHGAKFFAFITVLIIIRMIWTYASMPSDPSAGTFWVIMFGGWAGLWFMCRELGMSPLRKND
jgi:hypothetical protein